MKRILFVDDEASILSGLRRALHGQRREWDMVFYTSPVEALAMMAGGAQFDVVVSDMQMPDMNGADFLGKVMESYPLTVRLALSGHTDASNLLKANTVAHQLLSKPYDPRKLVILIKRACTLRDHLSSAALNQKLLEVAGVPSIPKAYHRIQQELQSEEPEIKSITKLIEQDIGLSTKILQLVNSAFMGLKHPVSDIVHASTLLGLDHIKALVLMVEVFSMEMDSRLRKRINMDALWFHSLWVAERAKRIAEAFSSEHTAASDAFTAGLLHEIGQIVLAQQLPEEFATAFDHAQEKNVSLLKAEQELFGSTHAAIGGYLLELWGLPDPVVEAITFYDFPTALPEEIHEDGEGDTWIPLTALHAAFYFSTETNQEELGTFPFELDARHLERMNVLDRLEEWRELCVD
jgi:HD-like signal output (HDOD) protein